MACLHSRMVRLHTHSLTYHVSVRVVSRCLPRGFRLPNVPPNRRGFPLTSLSLTSSHIKSVYTIQPVVKPVVKRV